ncbi:multidrug effflux MFS transporter [Flavobacterium sp. '19STA2R22 D10 B1']|uniref:multidrug effflux MFS transporter n=1 Tax=Flavobacterium aerium TaxID=3037261 RepID=UPI00278C6042|nr:multidrug effflux MFS transporter [Flavobacterium sp. '19STA2R22 D10 B1']
MTQQRYWTLILILGLLTALGPFSIDMYLPGFSAIAEDLGTTTEQVSLSLSSYFIGISAGQLLYGPLLDRFGRKKPLYIGLLVYILASLGCIAVREIESLIFLRFIQAVGSCAASVAAVAMVRDLFPVKDSPKIFALLMLVLGLSPMLAPTVGGYLISDLGWQSVFMVLACMGLLLLLASRFGLPNGYQPDTTISLKPKPIITNFITVLKEPQFFTYAFTGAMAFAGLFSYVAASPIVFMEIFDLSKKEYGWVFAFLSVGLIGSSQINSLLLKRFTSEQMVYAALISQFTVSAVFLIGAINGWFGLFGTIAMIFLFACSLGYSNPNCAGLALAPFAKNAGSASALMGATQMALGALASVIISLFKTPSTVPMVAVMAGSSLIALLILVIGRRYIKTPIETSDSTVITH